MALTESDQMKTHPHVYGNFRTPTSKGLAGLSTAGTIILLVGIVVGVFLMMFGLWVAALVFEMFLAVVLLLSMKKNKHGRTMIERIVRKVNWLNTRYSGANVYRAGPLSRVPSGTTKLPGIAAKSTLSEHKDGYGRPFAMVRIPQKNYYTAVLGSEPDAGGMVDQDQVNRWVDRYSMWLGQLTDEPGLVQAAVTVETAPDSGFRLARRVESEIQEDSPAFAQEVIREAVEMLPSGSTVTKAYTSLTYKAALRSGGKSRSEAEVATDLASRLPNITLGLGNTGAGAVEPVTAQELCEVVRVAYDPHEAVLFDQAHAQGKAPMLNWNEVGPQAHDAEWDWYHHDNAWSKTWTMSVPPRSAVQSRVLQSLIAPNSELMRKRITLLYRPIDPAAAAQLVEKDLNTATFNSSSSDRVSSRQSREMRAAKATEEEEAEGAGLLNFALIVTATVEDPRNRAMVDSMMDNLAVGARIRIEPAYGAQDSAFAVGLPLGLVVPEMLALPKSVRSALS